MPERKNGGSGSTDYKRRFNERAYDRLNIVVPKGRKERIEALAAERGQSVNGLIGTLIRREMGMTEAEWRSPGAAAEKKAPAEESGPSGGTELPYYLL